MFSFHRFPIYFSVTFSSDDFLIGRTVRTSEASEIPPARDT